MGPTQTLWLDIQQLEHPPLLLWRSPRPLFLDILPEEFRAKNSSPRGHHRDQLSQSRRDLLAHWKHYTTP